MWGSVGAYRRGAMGSSKYLLVVTVVSLFLGCAGFKGYPERTTLQRDDLDKLKPEISR